VFPQPIAEVVSATAIWLLALLVVATAQAAVQGVLTAAHDARGDSTLCRRRLVISRGVGLFGAALAATLLSPAARLGLIGVGVPVVFAVLAAGLYVVPLGRPALSAVASAELAGAIVTLPLVYLAAAGVAVPAGVVPIAYFAAASSAVAGGWLFGVQLDDWEFDDTEVLDGAGRAVTRLRQAARPYIGRAYLWCFWLALCGAVIGLGWAAFKPGLEAARPFVVAIAPFALVLGADLLFRWLSWFTLFTCGRNARYFLRVDRLSEFFRERSRPFMVLRRYRRALCDSCLLWNAPFESSYLGGHRICEKCGEEITFTGGPGSLVALVGDQAVPAPLPSRVFVRSVPEIISLGRQVDVTHIRLVAPEAMARDFERLTTYLKNEEPSDGLRSVRVYAVDGRGSLPAAVHNLIDDTYRWAETDPLGLGG
jgi:hypothetical protein